MFLKTKMIFDFFLNDSLLVTYQVLNTDFSITYYVLCEYLDLNIDFQSKQELENYSLFYTNSLIDLDIFFKYSKLW